MAARESLTVAALLDRIAEESGYATWLRDGTEEGEDRWANLQELRSVAVHYDDFPPELRLTAFLEEVALVSDQDELAEPEDRVTLLTVHTAKGLEFPVVFIVGLEENIFPHSRSKDDPDQMEEERRLMYVAVTRAKDRLYLVHAFRRMLYGRSEVNEPSRFLRDIKAVVSGHAGASAASRLSSGAAPYEDWRGRPAGRGQVGSRDGSLARPGAGAEPSADRHTAGSRPAAPPERVLQFNPGDRVDHGLFGQGIVLKSVASGDDEEVTVAFAGRGVKTLLAGFAKLRKLER